MTIERRLVAGVVESPAKPVTKDGSLRELVLAERAGDVSSFWLVCLATPTADADAAGLAKGDAVAFSGFVVHSKIPGDPLARRLTADAVFTLRDASSRPLHLTGGGGQGVTFKLLCEMLDRVERLAFAVGERVERLRFASIINSQEAIGRQSLAWALAEGGATVETALEALRLDKLASITTPPDLGAALIH